MATHRVSADACNDARASHVSPGASPASLLTAPALTVNDLLTVREAMALLHCKRSYVFKLINSGKVSYAQVGGHFVLKRVEIEGVLAQSWRRNGEIKVSESARKR